MWFRERCPHRYILRHIYFYDTGGIFIRSYTDLSLKCAYCGKTKIKSIKGKWDKDDFPEYLD